MNYYHQIVASELKDPICHSNECQIGSFSSEATKFWSHIFPAPTPRPFSCMRTYHGPNSCRRVIDIIKGDTLKQVPKFPSSEVPKFRSSQVPGASSSQFSSSGNCKFRNFEIKVNKKNVFSYFNKKHFRYSLLPFHALYRSPSCAHESNGIKCGFLDRAH